jgi:hypothetical protein
MKPRKLGVLLATVWVLGASQAALASTMYATGGTDITDLQWTLEDLDPDDGVAASMTADGFFLGVHNGVAGSNAYALTLQNALNGLGTLKTSVALIGPFPGVPTFDPSIGTFQVLRSEQNEFALFGPSSNMGALTLVPHTKLVLSAHTQVATGLAIAGEAANVFRHTPGADVGVTLEAHAAIHGAFVAPTLDGVSGSQWDSQHDSFDSATTQEPSGTNRDWIQFSDKDLLLTFVNDSDAPVTASLVLSQHSSYVEKIQVIAVPEPETLALLCAGFLVLRAVGAARHKV